MYGESVFTTMRMIDSRVIHWDWHFERLSKGAEFLYGPFTDGKDWTHILRNRLEAKFQDIEGDKVLRITLYKEQARGLLKTGLDSVTDLRINIQHTLFDPSRFESKMIKLRSCPVIKRPLWWPSFLKAGNYLETILSQKIHMKEGDDDILFLASDDRILESSVANIFVVKNNKLITAPVGPNVLDGIVRKKLLQIAPEFFDEVEEDSITVDQIYRSEGIIGTNSVRGLFLVDRIDDYEISYNQSFLEKFDKLKNGVFNDN